jgi:hypothetical protein
VVEAELNKVRTPLVEAGYAADQKAGGRLQWVTAVGMLINRHRFVETFSAPLLVTVHGLLAEIPGTAQMTGRWALMRLQTSLCQLGILDEPALLDRSHEQTASLPATWQNETSLDPLWGAWVRADLATRPRMGTRFPAGKPVTSFSWQADGSRSTIQT